MRGTAAAVQPLRLQLVRKPRFLAAVAGGRASTFINQGIRCNSICPGTLETPSMLDPRRCSRARTGKRSSIARQKDGPARHRRGKSRRWRSILASDEAAFTTGVDLVVDGGYNALTIYPTEGFFHHGQEQDRSQRPHGGRHRRRAGLWPRHPPNASSRSGAKVAIWDFDQSLAEKTAKEIGNAVSAFKVDVSDLGTSRSDGAMRRLKAFGKIDILVNNAGHRRHQQDGVGHRTSTNGRKVMRINLDGPFICCKALVPTMIAAKIRPPSSTSPPSPARKAIPNARALLGIQGRTDRADKNRSARNWLRHDILVNAVTPAAAKTAIFDQLTQQHIDFMLSKIPKNRFVLVEELGRHGGVALLPRTCGVSRPAPCSIFFGRPRDLLRRGRQSGRAADLSPGCQEHALERIERACRKGDQRRAAVVAAEGQLLHMAFGHATSQCAPFAETG